MDLNWKQPLVFASHKPSKELELTIPKSIALAQSHFSLASIPTLGPHLAPSKKQDRR